VARVTDAEQMIELLTYANYAKVAAALNVSRNAVSAWSRGRDVTPYRVRQVRDLLRPPSARDETEPQWARALLHQMAQAAADAQKEAAPPDWVKRLKDDALAEMKRHNDKLARSIRELIEDESPNGLIGRALRRAAAQLEAPEPTSGEESAVESQAKDDGQ
jgi:hypothetical protein